jgi:hypothetical protein
VGDHRSPTGVEDRHHRPLFAGAGGATQAEDELPDRFRLPAFHHPGHRGVVEAEVAGLFEAEGAMLPFREDPKSVSVHGPDPAHPL